MVQILMPYTPMQLMIFPLDVPAILGFVPVMSPPTFILGPTEYIDLL